MPIYKERCYVLDEREHATVLAALRFWQRTLPLFEEAPEDDIASNGGTIEPMELGEIDALCDRLNAS